MSESSVTLQRPAPESFFDRATQRLTLDVPPALTDLNAPGARGDLDLALECMGVEKAQCADQLNAGGLTGLFFFDQE